MNKFFLFFKSVLAGLDRENLLLALYLVATGLVVRTHQDYILIRRTCCKTPTIPRRRGIQQATRINRRYCRKSFSFVFF